MENIVQSLINTHTDLSVAVRHSGQLTWNSVTSIEEIVRGHQEKQIEHFEWLPPSHRLMISDISRNSATFVTPPPASPLATYPPSHLAGGTARLRSGERLWFKAVYPKTNLPTEHLDAAKKRLLREAAILSHVRSNFIPIFFGACLSVSHPFIAMEYVPSFSLFEILAQAAAHPAENRSPNKPKKVEEELQSVVQLMTSWETRWQMLTDIVVGLSVLHRHIPHPIAHRAFHSEHVLVEKSTLRTKICGLNNAYSPELEGDDEELNQAKAADLRGLGLILMELASLRPFTAVPPFLSENPPPSARACLSDDCDEDWVHVVDKCFNPQRADVEKIVGFLKKRKKLINRCACVCLVVCVVGSHECLLLCGNSLFFVGIYFDSFIADSQSKKTKPKN